MAVWVNVWGRTFGRRFGIVLVTSSLVGCIDDFDHPEGYGRADGTSNGSSTNQYDCTDLCDDTRACSDIPEYDCESQCVGIGNISREAGCQDEFDAVMKCISRLSDPCAQQESACYSEINDFSNCVSRFCDRQPERCATL